MIRIIPNSSSKNTKLIFHKSPQNLGFELANLLLGAAIRLPNHWDDVHLNVHQDDDVHLDIHHDHDVHLNVHYMDDVH